MPLLVFGAVCLTLAYLSVSSGTVEGPRRFPLWELFAALGGIGVSGGVASVFAGPDLDESPMFDSRTTAAPPILPPSRREARNEGPVSQPRRLEPRRPSAPAPLVAIRNDRDLPASMAASPLREPAIWSLPPFERPESTYPPRRSRSDLVARRVRSMDRPGPTERAATINQRTPPRETAEGVHAELDSLLASIARGAPVTEGRSTTAGDRSRCASCGTLVPESELDGACDRCGARLCEVCTALGDVGRGPLLCRSCGAGTAGRTKAAARPSGSPRPRSDGV